MFGLYEIVFQSTWGFPILEVLHVIGITLWVGSIALLDLRLVGLRKTTPMYKYHLVPWAYWGAVLTILTGLIFVIGNPVYLSNPAFWAKVVLIVAAAIVSYVFHTRFLDTAPPLQEGQAAPPQARFAGAASLVIWLGVLIAARMIPYVD